MTITEIAKLAGVSVSAVSRYLNDGYISEEKRERIKKVIEETGYRPSVQAQVLRTKRSKVIGVILPKISSESIGRVADGISTVLSAAGYQMLLVNTENDPKKELDYLRLLSNNPVDGIIFSATVFDQKHEAVMRSLNVPLVVIAQRIPGYAGVYHDDHGAGQAMTEILLQNGRRRVGHISVTQKDEAAGKCRTQGYVDALKKYEIPINASMIVEAGFTLDSGYECMNVLLERHPNLDGVFCATDTLAVGAMLCLKDHGIRIPEQMAVTGIGHNKLSKVVEPKLTTAHLHYKTSGIEAASMLLQMIEKKAITKQLELGYEVILAESTQKV